QAGLPTDGIEKAVASLDTDGNGSLNTDELTSAVAKRLAAHHPHPPNADEAASGLIGAFDLDKDEGLSLSEVAKGLNTEESDKLSALFSSLDADGDGVLNSGELSSAIQADMARKAYAQSAQLV